MTDHQLAADEALEYASQTGLLPEARSSFALTALAHLAALYLERTATRAVIIPAVPDTTLDECGCGLFTRCELHQRNRPKGCTCNGPYKAATCAVPTHRDEATRNPGRDPSRLE